jgi:hypothetical protein
MQLLYNSDSYTVVQIDLPEGDAGAQGDARGGYEIVDKFARKGIYIDGLLARTFRDGVQALMNSRPTEEALDAYIAGYTQLAQQPVVLH